ncbi:unnamed protein product [Vicia faba]|uniref:Uncharacterized protein n=1 Tax=Vicia faba TaxID=3906 RepID=A0AAV1A049_VICFA|nr:unnamed protein product [Vicia faba]
MDTKTLTWLFTRWLECMHGHALNGIITDDDKAMKNAIEIKELKNVLTCKGLSSRITEEHSSIPDHKKLARNKTQKNNQENKKGQSQEEGLCTPVVQEVEEHLGDISQVSYCPQTISHNGSCSELVQAQHNRNDQPSSQRHRSATTLGMPILVVPC